MLKTKFILLFFCSASFCFSQVEIVSIPRNAETTTSASKSARTAELTAMPLPFWDDFSFNIKNEMPNDTLWEADSKSVWVNNGSGINPPSIYVATFDGYDATGKPYSANDILAKGFADAMTSRPLKLGDVAPANRNAVFMTFFYQYPGNGDNPEPGDILSLLFKNADGQWIEVWSKTNDGTLSADKFVEAGPINIRSKESKPDEFFHNGFQFQFRSFGRLSGPYDVWNVDYVYVSNGKSQYAPVYLDFPDRTVMTPLTSMLKDYWAIPIKHFVKNTSSNISNPYTIISSQRKDQSPLSSPPTPGENVEYLSYVTITSKKQGVTKTNLNNSTLDPLPYGTPDSVELVLNNVLPSFNNYADNDTLTVKSEFILDSKDNNVKILNGGGDFDADVYKGINFKSNDTISATNILSNYYAYDDGKAEYGIKLTGKGTQLAYEFNMKTTESDNIIAIDIYFPKYGDDTNQYIQLFIASSLPTNESGYLFKQTYAVQRTTRNQFVRFKIPGTVSVKDKFYIGWQINSEVVIPVGLDRNSDSGSKIYSKVLGSATWEQNTTVYGSIMMRPVFGKAPDVILGVETTATGKPYPNPNSGIFYLPTEADRIQLFNLSGHSIDFVETQLTDKKQISILSPTTGLYLVRYFNQQWVTEKIVVK